MTAYAETYRQALEHPQQFWAEAAEAIDWERRWERVLDDSRPPFYRWFAGARLNTCWNALDRHVAAGRGERIALIWDSPVTGAVERFTYRQMRDRVARVAGMLAGLGVKAGDRVLIYMPLLPDAAIAEAREQPEACVVLQRPICRAELAPGRDHDWQELEAAARPADCVPVAATDPLYILYTSGTTGVPKGVVRDNGGHAVALAWSMRNIYGIAQDEVFWTASDVGWVVGHSYIVYGPLIHGCTSVMYEGKPVGTPDAGAF